MKAQPLQVFPAGGLGYVIHFLDYVREEDREKARESFPDDYAQALLETARLANARAAMHGGREFHNRFFGGGILFTGYTPEELAAHVSAVTERPYIASVQRPLYY
jgi:hypothetical protein